MPEHNILTGSELHEPKGVDSATADYVYVSDGSGSGNWKEKNIIDPYMWDDLTGSLIAHRLESTAGKLQYDYAENRIEMQSGGTLGTAADTLVFNFQWPHGAYPTGEMRLHVHWEQPDAQAYVFSGRYRIQNNGDARTTAWTNFTSTVGSGNDKYTYSSGTMNQITDLVQIPMTGIGISATVQFQLARTDSLTGSIYATFVDAHIPYNSAGSHQEFVK